MLTSSEACCGRPGCWRRRSACAQARSPDQPTRAIEDRAVDEAVAQQETAGLTVLTDGEMRRLSFQSQMVQAVEGFGEWNLDAFLWGDWHGDEAIGDWRRERPKELAVVAPLRRRRSLSAEEFVYLRGRTDQIPKVTLPSPGLFANFWSPERSRGAYASLAAFLEDVARILREEVEELAEYGASYIQLDAPHYPLLLDPKTRAFYEAQGWSTERMAGSGRRLGQPGDGRHRRRDLWPAPVPRQSGQPLAGLRRLRADRQADIPAYRGSPAAARVRRRAFGWVRAAAACSGRQNGRAGPDHDQARRARERGRTRQPASRWRAATSTASVWH